MSDLAFEAGELKGLLNELAKRLDERGVAADIHILGGSAMALLFPDDPDIRATRDVDAAFAPAAEVREIVEQMGRDLGLPKNWMNANATPFMPPRSTSHKPQSPVKISLASVEELIAMKLAASREQDLHDLAVLAKHAKITDPQRLVDIAFEYYGESSVVLNESRNDYLIIATQALQGPQRSRH